MGNCTISIELNKHTAALYYMSKTYNIDLKILFFLYEKYGPDVFYFFYLFSGKKISVFSESRMNNVFKFCDSALYIIKTNSNEIKLSDRDKAILEALRSDLDNNKNSIKVNCGLGDIYEKSV
jgi:hypothetical protein